MRSNNPADNRESRTTNSRVSATVPLHSQVVAVSIPGSWPEFSISLAVAPDIKTIQVTSPPLLIIAL